MSWLIPDRMLQLQWLNEITQLKIQWQRVDMKFAGGVVMQGALNQFGEILTDTKDTGQRNNDIGWLIPVGRFSKELWMLIWTTDAVSSLM